MKNQVKFQVKFHPTKKLPLTKKKIPCFYIPKGNQKKTIAIRINPIFTFFNSTYWAFLCFDISDTPLREKARIKTAIGFSQKLVF